MLRDWLLVTFGRWVFLLGLGTTILAVAAIGFADVASLRIALPYLLTVLALLFAASSFLAWRDERRKRLPTVALKRLHSPMSSSLIEDAVGMCVVSVDCRLSVVNNDSSPKSVHRAYLRFDRPGPLWTRKHVIDLPLNNWRTPVHNHLSGSTWISVRQIGWNGEMAPLNVAIPPGAESDDFELEFLQGWPLGSEPRKIRESRPTLILEIAGSAPLAWELSWGLRAEVPVG